MRLSLVGIGAVLQERDEYITIRELVPGGPPARQARRRRPHRRRRTRRQRRRSPTWVGARVDEAVKLDPRCQGFPKGRPRYPARRRRPLDGKHKLVPRPRQDLARGAGRQQKSIIKVGEGLTARRIGRRHQPLPAFYEDFDGRRRGDRDLPQRQPTKGPAGGRTAQGEGRRACSSTCATTWRRLAARRSSHRPVHRQGPGRPAALPRRPDRRRERRARRRRLGRPAGWAC